MSRAILIALFISLAGCSPPEEQPVSNPAQITLPLDTTQPLSRDELTVIIAAELAKVLSDGTRELRRSGRLSEVLARYRLPLFSAD